MSELILHHYPQSPFSEKVRLILGFKGLSWRSVLIPPVMPKPDLTTLTGGYRRTPVLQVGADIYCDSALIARRLEREEPTPALFPAGSEAVAASAAHFADEVLFLQAVAINFQPHGLEARFAGAPEGAVKAFMADRKDFFSGGTAKRIPPELALSQWPALLGRLEQQLNTSGTFLMGEEPTIVDFAHYHPLWFVASNKAVAEVLADYPQVRAWMDDLAVCGHGEWTKLSAAEAVEIAREAQPEPLPDTGFADAAGLTIGEAVTVSAVDYGTDPVTGTLVFQDAEEIVISREDERAGLVHVHFPRMGFLVKRQ